MGEKVSSGLLALLTLFGAAAGAWLFGSYRRAMNRAQRAILDSQKRIIDAAQTEHDETEVRLRSVETEIEELGLSDLAGRIDSVFGASGPLPPDDADGER